MCGRYVLDVPEEDLEAFLEPVNRKKLDIPRGELRPGDKALILAPNHQKQPEGYLGRWGFAVDQKRVFLARSETAAQKTLFSDGMKQRRCLVPASLYFEWGKVSPGRKNKYGFGLKDHGLFWMAGIYRIHGAEAEFAVLTRDAIPAYYDLHPRMPVILSWQQGITWLHTQMQYDMIRQASDPECEKMALLETDAQLSFLNQGFGTGFPSSS